MSTLADFIAAWTLYVEYIVSLIAGYGGYVA